MSDLPKLPSLYNYIKTRMLVEVGKCRAQEWIWRINSLCMGKKLKSEGIYSFFTPQLSGYPKSQTSLLMASQKTQNIFKYILDKSTR